MLNATAFLRLWWFIFTWLYTINKFASKLNGHCSSLQASLILICPNSDGSFLLHKTHLYWATVQRLQYSYWWCGLLYASRCVGTNTERKYIPHAVIPNLMHVASQQLFWGGGGSNPIIMKTKPLILQEVYFTIMYILVLY
jgi:hypothetical protein